MKKTVIFSLLIAFAITSFGQQQPASNLALTQADYLKKSKTQKTWAWITTGVGAAFIVTGLVTKNDNTFDGVPVFDEGESSLATTAYVIGGACIATGVVLFVASGKNKKKASAASVFIDVKKAPMLQQFVIRNQSFPAVGLRIGL